ncbi:MAG: DUF4493 domain-containing protein [Bacteroidales bacterium]
MKTKMGVVIMLVLFFTACDSLSIKEQDKVRISFIMGELPASYYREGALLKSNDLKMDTNNFILKVYSTQGNKVYDGKYGSKPKDFMVLPGGYEIKLYSRDFKSPLFDTPVFGDTLTAIVNENEQLNVKFNCKQISGGLKISFSDGFKKRFPGTGINITQEGGKLEYTYTETRYAHINSSWFTLVYSGNGKDTALLQKKIEASQMVNMNLTYSIPDGYNSTFAVKIDTIREWISENNNIGLRIPTGVFTIEEAKKSVGQKNISVF